jgi:hypothetical protein
MNKYSEYKDIQWISGSKPSSIPRVKAIGKGIWEPLDRAIIEQLDAAIKVSQELDATGGKR